MPDLAFFADAKKRRTFNQAFTSGYGLTGFVRWTVTEKPGRGFLIMTVLACCVAAALVGATSLLEPHISNAIFRFIVIAILLTLIAGSIFLPGIIADFFNKRVNAAADVTECTRRQKKTIAECDSQVASRARALK